MFRHFFSRDDFLHRGDDLHEALANRMSATGGPSMRRLPGIAVLGVQDRNIGRERRHEQQFLAREGQVMVLYSGCRSMNPVPRTERMGMKGRPQHGGAQLLDHGVAATVLDATSPGSQARR